MTVALGLLAVIVVVVAPSTRAAAATLAEARFVPAAGPLGPVTVIGDSVLMGATYEPSLPTLLAQRGWGPIQFRAGVGYSSGNFQPGGSEAAAANWIHWWRSAGWDARNVVVNLGSNDVGFCGTNVA